MSPTALKLNALAVNATLDAGSEPPRIPIRATWQPDLYQPVTGLSKHYGKVWIDADNGHGSVVINLTVSAEPRPYPEGFFASIVAHHDGIAILRELDRRGFLDRFQDTRASTFYDIFGCLHASGIPVTSHDSDLELLASRKMYELLTTPGGRRGRASTSYATEASS
jgi:hypothetical protein